MATWSGWAAGLLDFVSKGDHGLRDRLAERLMFDYDGRVFLPGSPIIASTSRELADIIHPMITGWERGVLLEHMVASAAEAHLVEVLPLQPFFEELVSLGLKIGLATNDGEVAARAHLKRAGITRYFDMILGFDSGFGGKPLPGQCNAFAEAMDLAPAEIAMIGDSLHDLDAGHAAGMLTIGVLTGPALRADLEPHADFVLNDIGELPAWLAARHG